VLNINIAIIDADLIGRKKHRFPNLACMKLSGYYKSQDNNIKLITDYRELFSQYIELPKNEYPKFDFILYDDINNKKYIRYYKEEDITFDKIIISKVFTDTPIPLQIKNLSICEYGGTGFFYDKAEPLPDHIEHHKPDYHLYDEWVNDKLIKGGKKLDYKYYIDYSIGRTSLGCFRKCEFCVNKNYDKVTLHSPIEEFLNEDRKYICLLDDNILGYGQWEKIFESLQQTNKRFEYKQGMDIRLLTNEKAKILTESNYIGDYIFAFDNINDKELIEEKLKLWRKYCTTKAQTTKLYVFCGFDRNNKWNNEFWIQDIKNTFERVKILMKYGCLPYIMRFNRYEESPYRGTYINLARWGNQPNFYKKVSYRKYCEMNQEYTKNSVCASMNYLNKFEKDYPDIAKEYYDLRFEELNEYKNVK